MISQKHLKIKSLTCLNAFRVYSCTVMTVGQITPLMELFQLRFIETKPVDVCESKTHLSQRLSESRK